MNDLHEEARRLSDEFLADTQYRLGFVEAEQPNPLTETLGETYRADTLAGVEMLIAADAKLADVYRDALSSADFSDFAGAVKAALARGGRVILSGCGSSGRLAMRLEASWREATGLDNVRTIMTGGDYALIRAVESFEDSTALGQKQASDLNITEKDLLIGITATLETTSVLGTAMEALARGAAVWMIGCTDPKSIIGKLKRVDDVLTHPLCRTLYLPVGGMAVTGSTRMQSSTIEQVIIGTALEMVLSAGKVPDFAKLFDQTITAMRDTAPLIASVTDEETKLYQKNGHVTYFASEFLLDVLADTTERGPTFSVPPFRPQTRTEEPLSWAFVKDPFHETEDAWHECFGHVPRCLSLSDKNAPDISLTALYGFRIGNEPDPERERGNSLALWIGEDVPAEFFESAAHYRNMDVLTFRPPEDPTRLDLFRHLYAKMMINTFSTGVMAKMGRIYGHYMVNMNISNKKLVDRGTRMIADFCGLSYEDANRELFYSKLTCGDASPVKDAIDRLKKE